MFQRKRVNVLRYFNRIAVAWLVLAIGQSTACAQVAATVDGETIDIADVERKLKKLEKTFLCIRRRKQ